MSYHQPVLLQECINGLNIRREGTYVDATFGGGGHSRAILNKLDANGRLLSFDQDEDVLGNLLDDDRFTFVHHNFRYLKRFLRLHSVKEVDGILADLGVSSHQLNEKDRGFSYRFDADLDMRMNQQGELKASDLLNRYSAEQLQSVFSKYGEVRNAKSLAQQIVSHRTHQKFRTTSDFLKLVDPLVRGNRARYLAQVFQSLRIEVNEEMKALEDFLLNAQEVLKPNGRLVIMSYHSLEDRMVKNFFKTGNVEGEMIKDFYGNIERPFKIITKKAVTPNEEELKINPRSRSAKLRIAEKI